MTHNFDQMIAEHRVGRFEVTSDLLRQHPQALMTIFRTFLPTDIEHRFASKSTIYLGFSPYFEKTALGECILEYNCVLDSDHTVTWEKVA